MTNIIDRRLNPRDKNIKNRQRFIERVKPQIKKAIKEHIDNGNIADIENGKAKIKVKGIKEPTFDYDRKTGDNDYVLPGNDKYSRGDEIEKEKSGSGGGASGEAGLGEGEDDFYFVLNQDEYLNFIFEDLELPDLAKKQIKDVTELRAQRSGFKNSGNPNQLDIVRSLRNAYARHIGLLRPEDDEIEEVERKLKLAKEKNDIELIIQLEKELKKLIEEQVEVDWIDPIDLKYRNFDLVPQPMTQAVMFCLLDVSGSMGEEEKSLAKRFFFLLHMFLKRKYKKVDIVFIKHHEKALEVEEEEFFYSRESGGTVVSSALELTKKIIESRYPLSDWNIYVAQCSDGDNFASDNDEVKRLMHILLPMLQYYAYVEIKSSIYRADRLSDIWLMYKVLSKKYKHLQMKEVSEVSDIWMVFKELFSKNVGD